MPRVDQLADDLAGNAGSLTCSTWFYQADFSSPVMLDSGPEFPLLIQRRDLPHLLSSMAE